MDSTRDLEFDALVVGGGIAGLQSALDLADQGFQSGDRGKRCIHRWENDPPVQGVSHPRLCQLHHHPQNGGGGAS